jgi:2-methylcitrate dehydratase
MLADGIVAPDEQSRFLDAVERLEQLTFSGIAQLNFVVDLSSLGKRGGSGIFDWNDRLGSRHADANVRA